MILLHHIFHSPKIPNRRPPLILIHGAGGSFLSWHPHLRRLDGETVYTLDLPGHGESDGRGKQSIRDYAEDVFVFMQEEGIQKPVLAGHSMGSAIALTIALEHPNNISGLALLGAGAKLRVSPLILEKAGSPDTFAEAVALVNEYSFSPDAPKDLLRLSNDNMLKTDRRTLLGDFLACDSFDVTDRIASIQIPTLILCGALDLMTPPKYSILLLEKIQNSRFHLVENSGHMIALEQPQAVAGLLKDFMDGLPPLT